MTPLERLNIYKKLSAHPKFETLPKRLQNVLTYLASGYTDAEISKLYKVSHGTPWCYRESIFKRYGFRVFEKGRINKHTNSSVRAMTMEEIRVKLKSKV